MPAPPWSFLQSGKLEMSVASGRCPILGAVSAPNPRLAESLAALSLAGDLGMGFALEHAVRVT
jgi:hypothetical protein